MKRRRYIPKNIPGLISQAMAEDQAIRDKQKEFDNKYTAQVVARSSVWSWLIMALLGFIVLFACISCGTKKPQRQPQVAVFTKEKIVEKRIPYALPADSSVVEALFECDSMNNVRLKELSELKAKGKQSQFSFNNGAFKYRLNSPPDTIYVPGKDSIIEREVPVYIPSDPEIIYKQTQMEVVFGWFGKIFMGLLGIGVIYCIIRWKLKR